MPEAAPKESLQEYFLDVSRYPIPSREEVTGLAEKIKEGDLEARNTLVTGFLRFVVMIAKEFVSFGINLEDLVAAGNMGLITAAEKYDGSMGFAFGTYARWWIRQRCFNEVSKKNVVDLPTYKFLVLMKIEREIQKKMPGEAVSSVDLAKKLSQHSIQDVDLLRQLQTPIRYDDEHQDFEEILSGSCLHEDPLDFVTKNDASYILDREMSKRLSPRSAEVIRRCFGLSSSSEERTDRQTLEEVGEYFGLSRERIRQIRNDALGTLRRSDLLKELH